MVLATFNGGWTIEAFTESDTLFRVVSFTWESWKLKDSHYPKLKRKQIPSIHLDLNYWEGWINLFIISDVKVMIVFFIISYLYKYSQWKTACVSMYLVAAVLTVPSESINKLMTSLNSFITSLENPGNHVCGVRSCFG